MQKTIIPIDKHEDPCKKQEFQRNNHQSPFNKTIVPTEQHHNPFNKTITPTENTRCPTKNNYSGENNNESLPMENVYHQNHTCYLELNLISFISNTEGRNRTLRIRIQPRYCWSNTRASPNKKTFLPRILDFSVPRS